MMPGGIMGSLKVIHGAGVSGTIRIGEKMGMIDRRPAWLKPESTTTYWGWFRL
jgi:hypothetical protein